MNIKNNDYPEKKRKRKILAIFLIAGFAILLFAGVIAAFYSDYVSNNGDVTTSTLDIEATYTVRLNGVETQLDSIKSLNPGDVITIKGQISNMGNQSAWIREKIVFTVSDQALWDYLQVYNILLTQDDLLSDEDYSDSILNVSGGFAASGNRVINGSGTGAQIQTGTDYDYIGAASYEFDITIYFMHSAPNSTQGQTIGTAVTTQALQFINNNAAEPDENAWDAVAAA